MAGHAVGAPAYAALAARLARPGDTAAADKACRWAVRHATPGVRAIMRRLPKRTNHGGDLGALVYRLQQELTARV